MNTVINQVFKFVNENQGYRASLGVISSSLAEQTVLAWGAVNKRTKEILVPELDKLQSSWPDAQWTPITQQQASLFDSAYERETAPREDWLVSL